MKSLFFVITVLCLLIARWTVDASSRQIQQDSLLNCSEYAKDYEIVQSFPYDVHIDPFFQYPSKTTYAFMNKDGNIYEMNIVSQDGIPSIIYCLQHLEKLVLRNISFFNSNQGLLSGIERFESSLIHLSIYDTILTHLPEQIGKLRRLKVLDLSNTGLMSLPNAIGDLSSLTLLFLHKNNLTSLPTTMRKLRLLEKIRLSNNPHLRSIQELNGLPSLESLEARHCSIERLPRDLPQLTVLHMSNNNLTKLDGIHTLGNGASNNKSFYFDMNNISLIPFEMQYVNNLYWLNMNQNKLNNLPLYIFNISTLRHFHILQNNFSVKESEKITNEFKKSNPKLHLRLLTNTTQ